MVGFSLRDDVQTIHFMNRFAGLFYSEKETLFVILLVEYLTMESRLSKLISAGSSTIQDCLAAFSS